jgi:hypothetical protein
VRNLSTGVVTQVATNRAGLGVIDADLGLFKNFSLRMINDLAVCRSGQKRSTPSTGPTLPGLTPTTNSSA